MPWTTAQGCSIDTDCDNPPTPTSFQGHNTQQHITYVISKPDSTHQDRFDWPLIKLHAPLIVDSRGLMFQQDLGPETGALAAAIDAYDPGPGWMPVLD